MSSRTALWVSFQFLGDFNQVWTERPQTRQGNLASPSTCPLTAGPAETKAVVPSQSATVARHLPVPSLATICAARTRFCSRLECPMPTGYHQGSGRQHLGASLACQFHSRPKLSPGKETSCRPPELGKLRCPKTAHLSPGAVPPARSEEPAASFSCQQASRLSPSHKQQGLLGQSAKDGACPRGHGPHPLGGSSLISRGDREARALEATACELYFYTGKRAS